MKASELTFGALRRANLKRLPLFKNKHGGLAHSKDDGSDWSPAQWLQAVVGEIGEYANLRKKFDRGDVGALEFQREAAKELADVVIYLDILAFQLGIDLGKATAEKWDAVSERIGISLRIGDEPEPQSYAARQVAWVEKHGIEVGSRVKVMRVPENHEDGWDNNAFPRMHDLVDKEVCVTQCGQTSAGISVEMPHIDFPAPHIYFPYFVLEPVEPAPQPPLQVREGGWYRRRDGKVVGPAEYDPWTENDPVPWVVGPRCYAADGSIKMTKDYHLDLIEEVPPPEQPGEAKSPEPDTAPLMIEPDRAEEVRHVKDGYIVGERLHVLMPGNVDAPQPATVDPGEGWRLLAKDEEVQKGDEYYDRFEWRMSSNWKVCDGEQDNFPYRRRVEPQPEPEPTYRPSSDALNIDISPSEEARALHRVVRAMHDGHCPACGHLDSAERFQRVVLLREVNHVCPECQFTVTWSESVAALSTFHPFMRRNLDVFKAWQAKRNGTPCGTNESEAK